jgi:FdhE protein
VVGLTRFTAGASGQRYLVCALCAAQWHLPRGRCAHCGSDKHVSYQALALAGDGSSDDPSDSSAAGDEASSRSAKAAVQAETCDDCGHYSKLMHSDRDPMIEPVADDLASLTLDLLVAQSGKQRHGVNLLLLFGAPDPGDR